MYPMIQKTDFIPPFLEVAEFYQRWRRCL